MRRLILLVLGGALLAFHGSPATAGPGHYDLAIAKVLADSGEWGEAGTHFENAVRQRPDDPYVRIEYGEYLLAGGAIEAAEAEATAALRLAPRDPDALRLIARVNLRRAGDRDGALERATEALETLRELDPYDIASQATLARIRLSQDRPAEALEIVLAARARHPGGVALLELLAEAATRAGDEGVAQAALRELLEVRPDSAAARLALADLLVGRGDRAAAIEVLRRAPETVPEIRRRLALALYRDGQAGAAVAILNDVLASDETDERSRFLRAVALAADGREGEAVAELEALLAVAESELSPGGEWADTPRVRPEQIVALLVELHSDAGRWQEIIDLTQPWVGSGRVGEGTALTYSQALAETGREPEAVEVLDAWFERTGSMRMRAAAIELLLATGDRAAADRRLAELSGRDDPEALLLVAGIYQRNERFSEAIDVLERLSGISPDRLQSRFWLASAYERVGRAEKAIEEFEQLIADYPDFAPALNYLGYLWADRSERLDEAVELIERALDIDPENGAYLDSLGWAYFRKGELDRAETYLALAGSLVGDDPVVLEHLGDLHSALGRSRQARETYARSAALAGENLASVQSKLTRLGGSSKLYRVRYDGPEGDGSMRLSLRSEGPGRFRLAATDLLGRALWTLDRASDGRVLLIDHRSEQACVADERFRLASLGLAELPFEAVPAVLEGRLPVEAPAVEGDSFNDAEGRRWTVRWNAETTPESWTLWGGGKPLIWWGRTASGGILSHRDGVQVRWRRTADEPLSEPLPPPEIPAETPLGRCDQTDVPRLGEEPSGTSGESR